MATLADRRVRVAKEIADQFASRSDVDGICLFGSLARGEPDSWSDIDLLVVGQDDELRPTLLLSTLPEGLRRERVSLVCYSTDELAELSNAGSSFVDHIRHEGRVLHDASGFLSRLLADNSGHDPDLQAELDAELARLAIYEDESLFRGNFLFCLAQLYAIGKAVVIIGLLATGKREYSRERAFRAFARRHPELETPAAKIEQLRPFYRLVTRRRPEPLPFPYRGDEAADAVDDAVKAIRLIASSIER